MPIIRRINCINEISGSTVRLPWLRFFRAFFLSCKTNARVTLAKTGHGPHSYNLVVICVVLSLFVPFCCYCVVLLLILLFCRYLCRSVVIVLYCCYLCCSVVICAVLLLLCCTVVNFVVLLSFMLFHVLFVCKCVLYHCHRVFTQLQLTNVSYHMSLCVDDRLVCRF